MNHPATTMQTSLENRLEVRLAGNHERLIVRHMMELYQHDFSEFDGTDLDQHGQYGYYDLDCFWINPQFQAYVFKCDGQWAGFALVNDEVYVPGSEGAIVEFFVLRKYRRQGLAQQAALAILQQHQRHWEIRVAQENPAAQSFWRKLISAHWPQHRELALHDDNWHGPVFCFEQR